MPKMLRHIFAIFTIVLLTYASAIEQVHADDTPIGDVFCTVGSWMAGNSGMGLAIIAVAICGVGAMLGKVSWPHLILVGIGISVVFGASALRAAISNEEEDRMICSSSIPPMVSQGSGDGDDPPRDPVLRLELPPAEAQELRALVR